MIEKIVHTAKQAVKAIVLAASAPRRWLSVTFMSSFIGSSRWWAAASPLLLFRKDASPGYAFGGVTLRERNR
jgi:hypothetical protein